MIIYRYIYYFDNCILTLTKDKQDQLCDDATYKINQVFKKYNKHRCKLSRLVVQLYVTQSTLLGSWWDKISFFVDQLPVVITNLCIHFRNFANYHNRINENQLKLLLTTHKRTHD
jgi:hypothetical protein